MPCPWRQESRCEFWINGKFEKLKLSPTSYKAKTRFFRFFYVILLCMKPEINIFIRVTSRAATPLHVLIWIARCFFFLSSDVKLAPHCFIRQVSSNQILKFIQKIPVISVQRSWNFDDYEVLRFFFHGFLWITKIEILPTTIKHA